MSTIGSYLLAVGLFLVAGYLVHSLFRGRPAPANPWGGASLEWKTSSPPPWDKFPSPPEVTDPYDFDPLQFDVKFVVFRVADDGVIPNVIPIKVII